MGGAQLRVIEGAERGALLRVEPDLLIGRLAPAEEGRLGGDAEISRRHARVSRGVEGALTIEDLGSANGTFVNDERIVAPRALAPRDVVRIGKTVLEVCAAPPASPDPALPDPTPPEAAATVHEPEPQPDPGMEDSRAEPILLIVSADGEDRRVSVRDELVIGRGVEGDGRITDDAQISRRHARIGRSARGQLTVEDLGSANGTFLNGERIGRLEQLGPRDVVRIGATTLRMADVASEPSPPAADPAPPAANRPTPPRAMPPSPPRATPPAPPRAIPPSPPRAIPPTPRAPARPAVPSPPAVPAGVDAFALPAGSVFAGCRVEAAIGHGDMGVVYRAEELALQRPVALKLILPQYSDDARFRERFRRESRIAAAIDHQNVIPVFDAGDERGVLYIMMRLVEGTDLRTLIAGAGALEPRRAAHIVRQVGAALDAAHARGMLHRDVKPSNVLLARRDHVYLTDFGLAKEAGAERGLTRQGTVVARAEYVAPEQILGQPVDARADIYALGCLLFETLTGEPPFARPTDGAGALAHLDAPRPSPLALRPDLPAGFEEVVQRAMATDPAERYSSAGDLGRAAVLAAGGRRREGPWSVVATGAAALFGDGAAANEGDVDVPPAEPVGTSVRAGRHDLVRWAIAVAGLVLVAIGMVGALHGISTL